MVQQLFKGKCIGGIADGREYQFDKPEMEVEQRKKDSSGLVTKTGQKTVYKFLLLLGNIRGDIGVWVPEGTELDAVIQRLVLFYDPSPKAGKLINLNG